MHNRGLLLDKCLSFRQLIGTFWLRRARLDAKRWTDIRLTLGGTLLMLLPGCGIFEPRYERRDLEEIQRSIDQAENNQKEDRESGEQDEPNLSDPTMRQVRLNLRPNVNWLDPSELNVELRCESTIKRDITVSLVSKDEPWQLPAITLDALYDTIQSSCVSCHSSSFAMGDLNLSSIPFSSSKIESLDDIFAIVALRVLDEQNPMPPQGASNEMKQGFRLWRDTGFVRSVDDTIPEWTYSGQLFHSEKLTGCEAIISDTEGELIFSQMIEPPLLSGSASIDLSLAM